MPISTVAEGEHLGIVKAMALFVRAMPVPKAPWVAETFPPR